MLFARFGGAVVFEAVEASEAEEDDRVNGLVNAVDRLNGLEEAGAGAG